LTSVRLTYEIASTIRDRYQNGEQQVALAKEYGVSKASIWNIISMRTYGSPRVYVTDTEAKRRKKNLRMLKEYGITLEQWEKMLEDANYSCEGCGEHLEEQQPHHRSGEVFLVCDHDHATGAVRGVLCYHCNNALGRVKDSPEILRNLANYLEKGKKF
jgi:hypothetical protein